MPPAGHLNSRAVGCVGEKLEVAGLCVGESGQADAEDRPQDQEQGQVDKGVVQVVGWGVRGVVGRRGRGQMQVVVGRVGRRSEGSPPPLHSVLHHVLRHRIPGPRRAVPAVGPEFKEVSTQSDSHSVERRLFNV